MTLYKNLTKPEPKTKAFIMNFELEPVLAKLGIPEQYRPALGEGWDGTLHSDEFLHPENLRKNAETAQFQPDKIERLLSFAAKIEAVPEAKALICHESRTLRELDPGKMTQWPEIIPFFGTDSGMFHLIAGLSLVPDYPLAAKRFRYPEKYALQAAARFPTLTVFFAENYGGAFGVLPKSLVWMRHYKNGTHFRVGRFDYQDMFYPPDWPLLFRSRTTGKYALLCNDGLPFGHDLQMLRRNHPESEAAGKTVLEENGLCWRGTGVSLAGNVLPSPLRTLEKAEWECLVHPGSHTAAIHIPGGGGMTPQLARESLKEAEEFFRKYRAPVSAFTCVTWILNPELAAMLPGSNISRFAELGIPFPVSSSEKGVDGLYFVFGRDGGDLRTYPRDNSLRKAMMSILDSGRLLRSGGMIVPTETV